MNTEENFSRAEIRRDGKEYEKSLDMYDEIMRKLYIRNEFCGEQRARAVEGMGRVFEAQGKWLAALSEFWIAANYVRQSCDEELPLRLFSEILSCIHKARKEGIDVESNLKDLKTAIVFAVMHKDRSCCAEAYPRFVNLMKIACETEIEFDQFMSYIKSMDAGQDSFNSGYKESAAEHAQRALDISECLEDEELQASAKILLEKAPRATNIYAGATGC